MGKLDELKDIIELGSLRDDLIDFQELGEISTPKAKYPVYAFCIGSKDPTAPTFGIFGGVHGLERVGTHVTISFLQHLTERLSWDQDLRELFGRIRVISIPLVNPGGMAMIKRSNPNRVDLMRNAPVEAEVSKFHLYSGQRIGPWIPWYRGKEGVLEKENQLLIEFLKKYLFDAAFAMSIDIHSGFGIKDRIWYPYARTTRPFEYEHIARRFRYSLDRSYPYHVYHIEQQSDSYLINGDLWDYAFELFEQNKKDPSQIFIPWTLELGSWSWVKKNPLQAFSVLGLFNPIKQHRYYRIMRRHLLLFGHFYRIISNYQYLLDDEKWRLK